ncbi:MAG TPA: hypothetical protein VFQ60_04330 [Patescibacteria group bacterium]|nr:hypothetical protein [Patescibacteria group bacterium]
MLMQTGESFSELNQRKRFEWIDKELLVKTDKRPIEEGSMVITLGDEYHDYIVLEKTADGQFRIAPKNNLTRPEERLYSADELFDIHDFLEVERRAKLKFPPDLTERMEDEALIQEIRNRPKRYLH